MSDMIESRFTVRGSPEVVGRFTRLLASLHLASTWGCSRKFAMPLDGDGPESLLVDADEWDEVLDEVSEDLGKAMNTGRGVVVSYDDDYDSFELNRR